MGKQPDVTATLTYKVRNLDKVAHVSFLHFQSEFGERVVEYCRYLPLEGGG